MIEANLSHRPRAARDPSEDPDLFELFFGGQSRPYKPIGMQGDIGWRPATDVYETAEEFVIQMDLAGMTSDRIEVLVEDEFVVIKGVREDIAPPGKKHFHKMEILVGPFERHVRIPSYVDATSARAEYASGFLFVRMRRGEGRCKERRSVSISG